MVKKNAAILFYNQKKEILLQLRDDTPTISWPNHWCCIGGVVEDGETVEEGLVREVREEIEYELKEYESMGVLNIREGREYYMFIAPLELSTEEIILHEGQKVAFFEPKAALELPLTKGTRYLVEKYIKKMSL